MKITNKICYGLRILEVLAGEYKRNGSNYVSSSIIASREKISKRYTDSLLSLLTLADIVVARHGSAGGYALTRAPSSITVRDIFEGLEGSALSSRCLDKKSGCSKRSDCSGRRIWKKLECEILKTLTNTTLADL
ncbi:MAG: Rrf2 family transcriptional regulator [Endomicrobiia bacterium]|nr:Rrf2 family transcriptional regulator [Endomicrobiia bacterium]